MQSDTQLLHHKLDSQQSHLTRLTQQLASLASATTGTKASGNSGVAAGYAEGRSPKGISRARTEAAGLATAEHSALVGATGTEAAVFGAADVTAAAEYDEVDKLDMDNLQEQLQQQLVGLEVLAEAVCLLATGQAAAAADLAGSPSPTAAEPGGHVNGPTNATTDTAGSFSFGRRAAAGSGGATGTAETKAAAVAGIGFLGAAASPQLSRLRRLLQTGQVGRKLDWFDPVLLQKMVSLRCRCTFGRRRAEPWAGPAGCDMFQFDKLSQCNALSPTWACRVMLSGVWFLPSGLCAFSTWIVQQKKACSAGYDSHMQCCL